MRWRTDKPEEGERVIIYMPAYMRRAPGSGRRFPVRDNIGIAEWWDDHPGQPDGLWFYKKEGNMIVNRPVTHWMAIPMPDEEMADHSAAIYAAGKAEAKAAKAAT